MAPPKKSFEEALDELLTEYEGTDTDEIISTLELHLTTLQEAAEEDTGNSEDDEG